MVGIEILGMLAIILGLSGAIYVDGRRQNNETADMWAVGFFIRMLFLPSSV